MSQLGSRVRGGFQRAHRADFSILIISYALLLWGLVMMFSIGPVLTQLTDVSVLKQFVTILIGTAVFWTASKVKLEEWRVYLPYLMIASIVATLLLLLPSGIVSTDANGAVRWLSIGSISFQPAELVKLTSIIYLSVFLSNRIKMKEVDDPKATIIPVGIMLAVIGLFVAVFQRDLGTMMVIAAVVFAMLYIAGVPKSNLFGLFIIGMIGVALMVLIAPHRIARISTFLTPEADPTGSGYHVQQSLIAIGSGGFSGVGVGHSVQAFGYLPEAANDSIFAIHAETIGFIGVVAVLLLYAYLLRRLHYQVAAASNSYNQLLATGIFVWILSHIVINVGGMLGLMPLTGITLPLLSYGGSSLVLIMLALGIVFNMSRYSKLGISSGHKSRGV